MKKKNFHLSLKFLNNFLYVIYQLKQTEWLFLIDSLTNSTSNYSNRWLKSVTQNISDKIQNLNFIGH